MNTSREEKLAVKASWFMPVASTKFCKCGSRYYIEEGRYTCPTADFTDKCDNISLKPEDVGVDLSEDPDDGGIPCIDCGFASGKNPCPRCGRYKW